jgi:hypothetical protein
VTVVGEVPPDTLRIIATGLRPAEQPAPAPAAAERRN